VSDSGGTPSPPWMIPEYLSEILSDDPAIAGELVELFFTDAAETVTKLLGSVLRRDVRSVCDLTHKLIGGSRQLGVPEIAAVAENIETTARQCDWDNMPSSLACLQHMLRSFDLEVKNRLKGGARDLVGVTESSRCASDALRGKSSARIIPE
jgi:HPt (histidine-containing phosphotransfer) domain-containing protein